MVYCVLFFLRKLSSVIWCRWVYFRVFLVETKFRNFQVKLQITTILQSTTVAKTQSTLNNFQSISTTYNDMGNSDGSAESPPGPFNNSMAVV